MVDRVDFVTAYDVYDVSLAGAVDVLERSFRGNSGGDHADVRGGDVLPPPALAQGRRPWLMLEGEALDRALVAMAGFYAFFLVLVLRSFA